MYCCCSYFVGSLVWPASPNSEKVASLDLRNLTVNLTVFSEVFSDIVPEIESEITHYRSTATNLSGTAHTTCHATPRRKAELTSQDGWLS